MSGILRWQTLLPLLLVLLVPRALAAQIASPACPDATDGTACVGETGALKIHVAIGAMLAAQGTDLGTTMYAIGTGRFREGNPLLASWVSPRRQAAVGGVKLAFAAAEGYCLLKMHKDHPRLVFWSAIAQTAVSSWATWHNARLLRR